jgi:hypothetical protein
MLEPETYPPREPFFSHRFVRLLAKVCAAQDIGPAGAWLLTVIVQTEDAAHYKRAVTWYDAQLLPILGVDSQKTLARIRNKAVEAGWLHYEAGCKGRVSRYWVMIPEQAQDLDDFPSDEGEPPIHGESAVIFTGNRESNRERNGNESGTMRRGNGQPFYPIPIPVPDPSKPIGARSGASNRFRLWKNAKRQEFSDPTNVERVFRLALAAKICTADERLHVFRLVASLVATLKPKDNLPGLLTSILRGDAGKDPWRARGIEHEDTAREWMRSLDCPPEMQRRTSDLMSEVDPNTERDRQRAALKAKYAARDGPPPVDRQSA